MAVGYLAYNRQPQGGQSAKDDQSEIATTDQQDKRYDAAIDKNLKAGNYESYQISKLELANGYITERNYGRAEAILAEVKVNIPADKLQTYYYQLAIQIDQHNQDVGLEKADLRGLISALKARGLSDEIKVYQTQLDKLDGN